MQLDTLLIINTALCLLRGVGFIVAPAKLWKGFSIYLERGTAFPVQLLGAAYIATAAMNVAAIKFADETAIQPVIIFNFIVEFIGAVLSVIGIFRNAISKLAWIPFCIHLCLAVGFGYFLFT